MSVLQGSVYVAELVADSDLSGAVVACTITAPDLTVSTVNSTGGAVVISATVATVPVLATQVGTYLLVWSVTGAVTGTQQDQFTVKPAVPDLISLPDVKEELNLRPTDTTKDVKLRRYISAANTVVENITGPIRAYPQVDIFDGGVASVVLMARWVSGITQVTENWAGTDYLLTEQPLGAQTTTYGYTWDRDTNTITRRLPGGQAADFFPGYRNVTVAYTGGLTTIPDDIQIAAAELVRHWYRRNEVAYRSTGAGGAFGAVPDDGGMMVGNYLVPNAVLEILDAYRRPPGIF